MLTQLRRHLLCCGSRDRVRRLGRRIERLGERGKEGPERRRRVGRVEDGQVGIWADEDARVEERLHLGPVRVQGRAAQAAERLRAEEARHTATGGDASIGRQDVLALVADKLDEVVRGLPTRREMEAGES